MVVNEKRGVAETAGLFAVCELVVVEFSEGMVDFLKLLGWVVCRLSR